jgi:hypothetical protein
VTVRTYIRFPVRVTASKNSAERMASAWERRNAGQVWLVRSVAGSMPASLRISQTVDAATVIPRMSSSPWDTPIPPRAVLPRQAQDPDTDRPDGARPTGTLWA